MKRLTLVVVVALASLGLSERRALAGAYLSGTGPQLAGPVELVGGLVKFEISHEGTSNFSVVIKRANGEYIDLLVNVIGSYSGSRAIGIKSGNFVFDVDADGSWSIKVSKPWRYPRSLPSRYEGQGDRAVRAFRTDGGLLKISYSYSGESNFAIVLWKTTGRYIDLVANEIGSTSGSTGVTVGKGKYVLDTQAEGVWVVKVRRLSPG